MLTSFSPNCILLYKYSDGLWSYKETHKKSKNSSATFAQSFHNGVGAEATQVPNELEYKEY